MSSSNEKYRSFEDVDEKYGQVQNISQCILLVLMLVFMKFPARFVIHLYTFTACKQITYPTLLK